MFEQITKFADEATTNINKSVNDTVSDVSDTITDTINEAMKDNDIAERFTTTSDQVLDAVLDTNRRVVDFAVTTADRINEQIKLDVPFGDSFPTPTIAGERYLEFVERAVSLNRDLNQRVVEMIKADNAKTSTAKRTTAEKTTTSKRTATKRPAKKTAAKKTAAKRTAAKKAAASK